jgi:hypothetical protein
MSEAAPGLARRARGTGQRPTYYWIAPPAAVAAGFRPKTVRLADTLSDAEMASACRILQAEAREWLARGSVERPVFDGSLRRLMDLYQTDRELSTFSRLKPQTRQEYARIMGILQREVGERQLSKLTGRDFQRWYASFRAPVEEGGPERPARAAAMMDMIRVVMNYGVVAEVDPRCATLALILRKMRFEGSRPRQSYLTADMVVAFRKAAHAAGKPSMAMGMALQFETALRQRDVIGEWVPAPAATPGPLAGTGKRWTTGLVWGEHIDADLVLRKPTSKSGGRKLAAVDLRLCPMVMDELEHVPAERRVGPVIICEGTGQPYTAWWYSTLWRKIATKAKIPAGVCNMDARAGAVTEANEAGVDLEHLRALATHSDAAMTQRYNRVTMEKTAEVMRLRVARRRKVDGS